MATATMVRLVPRAGWVLIQPRAVVSEVTKMGIIKVDQSGEKPQTGVVLAVGPDVNADVPPTPIPGGRAPLQPGALVLYGKYAGVEVDLGDYEAILLDVRDIMAGVELHEVETEDEPAAEPLIEVAAR